MDQIKLLIDAKNQLGECVLWCDRTHRVFWTDILLARLHAYEPASGASKTWDMPERLSNFALTEDDNRLLLGLASRMAFFDLDSGEITPICTVEADLPTTRVNDGRCDRQGRFVFGTMNEAKGKPAIGGFYRLNKDLSLQRLPLPAVSIANSICFSPDGNSMYFCDSMKGIIYRWDGYGSGHTDAGLLHAIVDLSESSGAPDGSVIDAEGFLWNAQWGGERVVRYTSDGREDRVLPVPTSQPSCVCLGGPQFDELFVTTARDWLSEEKLAAQPQAGGLFHTQLQHIRGLPESRFAGSA
ncbi:SMP-30/gluconolactonase/LRE family protein [Undibacterium sp.]|uniref:SMP-30/gluconolactonase/LRE family protein n=1 Tax=Undibacterium sp. TaxID=1914977 RepID=UPI00374D4B3D